MLTSCRTESLAALKSSLSLVLALAVVLFARPASADDRVSGHDVKDMCGKIALCHGANPDADAFCALANVDPKPGGSPWDGVNVPTVKQLQGLTCPPPAPGVPLPAAAPAPPLAMSTSGSQALNQSTFIWGATEFLLNRASAELQAWAVDKFVGLICDDPKYSQLDGNALFANSCKVLKTLSLDGFLGSLSALQSAMKLDFAHLPVILLNHVRLQAKDPTILDVTGLAMLLADVLEANLDGTTGIPSLSAALKITPAPPVSCRTLPATTDAWELMTFIASQPVDTSKKVLLPGDGTGSSQDLMAWRYAVMAFGVNVGDPATSLGATWPADCHNGSKFAFNPAVLFAGTVGVRDSVATIEKALADLRALPANADPTARLQLYAKVVAASLSPFADLVAADAALAGEANSVGKAITDANRISADFAAGSYGSVVVDILQTVTDFGGSGDWVNTVARLASFGADVAQATTADAVAAAINRGAAPVGSYKRKRMGGWYADLNAYVGLSAAAEYTYGDGNQWSGGAWGFVPGFWAPVGFEFGGGQVCGGSLGVLLQAVDLGALASWRVSASGDQVSSPPNVTFEQIMSPGAALVYGLPSAPLSTALRFEWVPSLRQVGQTGSYRNAVMIGASLAVDIPLFP